MIMEKATQDEESLLLFLEAVARGNLEEIIGHLSADPRLINTQHPESGDTALIVAAGENNVEAITLLLEHGADVTLYNSSNLTAVHVANDVIRTQLLTASTRTEFPQLGLAQAAWQGDLENIQHLLSTEHCHYVNSRNEQGLTPVMLVVRDVDFFVGLAMETEYRPLAVLEELLKHHADTQLLDPHGNSAMSYISDTKSPLREQLTAVLEKSPPSTETQDEAFCDFCPDTKPPLSDTPLPGLNSTNIHSSRDPEKERSCDGFHTDFVSKDLNPGAELGTVLDIEETSTSIPAMETADQMKKISISQLGCTDPSPEHSTLQSATKRHQSPLHMKKEYDVSQLERLGLGYLMQCSQSNPNISESHFRKDPLRDIKYIKENIRQRLGSADSSKNSQTYPPSSHSPRRSQSVRLAPLSRTGLRNKEANISYIDLNSKTFTTLKADGQLCGNNTLRTSIDNSEDVLLSKDLIQISCPSYSSESNHGLMNDPLTISQQRTINGFGRTATVEVSEDINSAGLHSCCTNVVPELPGHDKTQISNPTESESTLLGEQIICEVNIRNIHSENEKYVPDQSDETEKKKHKDSSSNRKADEIWETPEAIHEDGRKRNDPLKSDISKTPKQGHVPFVHITFSKCGKQKSVREQVIAIRKTNQVSPPHVSHSFNIHAQKENKKTKKKTRSMSAPDCATKQQRPLFISKRTHGKVVPLPALVFSSVPTSSKVSNKFTHTDPNSINVNRQRLQTQSCLYTTKRPNSSVNTPKPPRAKTSMDFQDLGYSDMFAEIKPQDSGPVISQMFATPVYANTSKSYREANSASSIRSCSSKGSRASSSRDSSARGSKRPNSKHKKNPSATRHRRKKSSTKQLATEDIETSVGEPVIISGMDWEIKTIKKDMLFSGNGIDLQLNGNTDPNQENFSCLSIIKEATIEKSLTPNGTGNVTLIKGFRELREIFKDVESVEPKCLSHTLPTESINTEGVQQSFCRNSSNRQNEDSPGVQDPNIGSLIQSLKELCAPTEQSSGAVPQSQTAASEILTYNEHFWREILIENNVCGNNLDQQNYNSQSYKSADNCTGSDQLTDELISHLEKNLVLSDKEPSDTKPLASQTGNDDESLNFEEQQFSRNHSLEYNTNNSNHSEMSQNDSSIIWIKGEVLGKGAYGTVYRGLTSQGELIAAKQVMLHGSDPAEAEKEYRKLQEEVDLLKTLKHVNIVGYLGTCLQDTVVTIFMEFVPGGSISSILKHFGPLQESIISNYTNHILQGIAYLHKNRVVHRDIKGNNVMLMPNGVIKLIDFGCAKRLNGLSMNGTQWEMLTSMHGTPYWMAPEVICESGHGEKSDIWSIGCTVFEMATGKPPLAHMHKLAAMFYIGKKQGLMPTLPGHFSKRARNFVDLCLTRDQEDRPFAEQLLQHSFIRQKL